MALVEVRKQVIDAAKVLAESMTHDLQCNLVTQDRRCSCGACRDEADARVEFYRKLRVYEALYPHEAQP